jgi:hypothetical protein
MPVSSTVCGLLGSLSVTVKVPVRRPAAVGVKVMGTVQAAYWSADSLQVSVVEKSPVTVTEWKFMGVVL